MNANKLIKASDQPFNRKNLHTVRFARDFDELVSQYDTSKILGASRSLYHNNPLVKSAIDKKASYTISNAFEYRSKSQTEEAKNSFDRAIKQWSKIAEVSGKNLNDVAWLTSVSLDVDGDVFILLSQTKTGYPVIQLIESHAVGSRHNGKLKKGKTYEEKGVIYDSKTKRPLFYRILATEETDDITISVNDMIRISEPSFSVRGNPLITSAISLLNDLTHSQELLLTQQLMAASTSMIEHNETGGNEYITDDDASEGLNIETITQEGGEIRFMKAGTGSKLEIVSNPNPSIPWQEYQDTLFSMVCLALDWPKNLVGFDGGNGVNDRLAIQQATKACIDRKTLLEPYFIRICNWALAKMIKNGFIKVDLPDDWFEAYMTNGRRLSVDLSRDSKSIQEEYKLGIRSLTSILGEEGVEHDDHVYECFTDEAKRILIQQRVEEEYEVKIDPLNVRLFNPTQYQNDPKHEQL